ncbi:MAG: ftsQ [Ilumatobacteraceae bacterium]|nr:ftsQ [Ilumatobacteraceae bacterium]
MSEPRLPLGEGSVPDKALEELLAAFASDTPAHAAAIDFDDPSIDRMLGLGDDAHVDAPNHGSPSDDASPAAGLVTQPVDEIVTGQLPPTASTPTTPAPPDAPVDGTADAPHIDQAGGVGDHADAPIVTSAVDAVPADPEPVRSPSDPPQRATIKIGGGDDLPDALYLDEEAGDRLRGAGRATEASIREERTTILIAADDEMEGASGGIPLATGPSSMDPRLRARRIAVKRAVGRKRLKWFVLAGVIILVLTAGFAVLGSSLFAVNNVNDITISGARRISQTDLDAAIKRIVHHPVLLIDTHSIEAQLERSPWVREARVSVHFPHTASIELLERVPLATYAGPDGKFRIIDVEGRVVDVIQNQPVEFMLITGNGVNASPGTSAGDGFTHAAELVEALSPAVRSRTASIGVSETGALSIAFHNGATVQLGAPTELLDKLTRLEAFLAKDDDACTGTIDVATNEIGSCGGGGS